MMPYYLVTFRFVGGCRGIRGAVLFTRVTWELLDRPEHVIVMFNRSAETIALKPIRSSITNAFPVFPHGKHGARVVRADSLVRQFRIRLDKTVRFCGSEIDDEGILLLDLTTTAPAAPVRRSRKPVSE